MKEIVSGEYPGLICLPKNATPILDGEYQQNFNLACGVYAADRAGDSIIRYNRRFIVYAPDAETLPTVRRVAKTLLLLYSLQKEKMAHDHARNSPTVEVWLMRQGGGVAAEAGGRQLKNQIYIFNLLTERAPTEWLREVAHEYGHYILPGISGFTAPEEWGNGVLGERLLLRWIDQAIRNGRIPPESLPFATPEALQAHLKARVEPLLQRALSEGLNEGAMKRRDADGMNYFTGAALYIDAVYGARALRDAFAFTESENGSIFLKGGDFYRGIVKSLETANEIPLFLPLRKREATVETLFVYLPRGEFRVTPEKTLKRWEIVTGDSGIASQTPASLFVSRAGWRKLKLYLKQETQEPVGLTLHRRGAEVN
jgi:hypothetical protein